MRQIDGVGPDVAPSEIEHFAPAAAAECQKPDRSDGLAPLSLANVERAPEPRQLVRVKGTSKNAIFAHRRFRIGLTIC